MNNTGLFSGRKMEDGTEIIGYLIKCAIFEWIIPQADVDEMKVDGHNEQYVAVKLTRILDGSAKPLE